MLGRPRPDFEFVLSRVRYWQNVHHGAVLLYPLEELTETCLSRWDDAPPSTADIEALARDVYLEYMRRERELVDCWEREIRETLIQLRSSRPVDIADVGDLTQDCLELFLRMWQRDCHSLDSPAYRILLIRSRFLDAVRRATRRRRPPDWTNASPPVIIDPTAPAATEWILGNLPDPGIDPAAAAAAADHLEHLRDILFNRCIPRMRADGLASAANALEAYLRYGNTPSRAIEASGLEPSAYYHARTRAIVYLDQNCRNEFRSARDHAALVMILVARLAKERGFVALLAGSWVGMALAVLAVCGALTVCLVNRSAEPAAGGGLTPAARPEGRKPPMVEADPPPAKGPPRRPLTRPQ